jgi:di/tricarboxylate transporter
MSEIETVFAIIALVIVFFMWDRLPVIVVCVGAALSLWATGILTLPQSLAGFGDPATIFVASLFVVSAGLETTGVTAWAGKLLIDKAGASRVRLVVLMMLLVGVLAALISVNGAVAALLPVVVVIAVRLGRPPSQLLMPLAFGAHCGSLLALTGTPVNVLVMEASQEAGGGGFGYFEFAFAGIPLVAGCILIAVVLGPRLLPIRASASLPPDLTGHARTLVEAFRLSSDVHQLKVRADSPLVGTARRDLALPVEHGASLVTVKEAGTRPAARTGTIEAGDVIVVRGTAEAAGALATDLALAPHEDVGDTADILFNRQSGLAEVVIPPRSKLAGERVFPGMVSPSGDLIVLAVQRQGRELPAGETLAVGDTLLLQGTWSALERRLGAADVLVVDSPELVRRQAVPLGTGATTMLAILAAMVVLLATGIVPAAVAGLLAAGAVLVTGILTVEQTYRAIGWTTVILVGAMMPLSTAIAETGAAALIADRLVALVGDAGPLALVAGLFVVTAVLGQVISNTATALIIIPIAVIAAGDMGVSPQPVLMSVAVAAAAALLTPVATPMNLAIMEPAGYRFGDYWRFGLAMMVWYFVIAVGLVPLIWPF